MICGEALAEHAENLFVVECLVQTIIGLVARTTVFTAVPPRGLRLRLGQHPHFGL